MDDNAADNEMQDSNLEPSTTQSGKRGREPSTVWKYFTEDEKPQQKLSATCKHCKQPVSYHKKSEQVITHMNRCSAFKAVMMKTAVGERPEWYRSVKRNVGSGTIISTTPSTNQKPQVQQLISKFQLPLMAAAEKKEFQRLMALHYYNRNTPFAHIECPLLAKALRLLRPDVDIPNRRNLSEDLLENSYSNTKAKVDLLVGDPDELVCYTSDAWSNINRDSVVTYMGVFKNVTLFTEAVYTGQQKHTAEWISTDLQRVIDSTTAQVSGACTDNTSTNKAAWKLLKTKYPAKFFYGCVCHALHLFVKDIFGVKKKLRANALMPSYPVGFPFERKLMFVESCKELVQFFRSHQVVKALLEAKQVAAKVPKLASPAPTRWGSVRATLKSIRKSEAVLHSLVSERDFLPGPRDQQTKRRLIHELVTAPQFVGSLDEFAARACRCMTEGVRLCARTTVDMTRRPSIRKNHGSASRRLNVLIKNLRKEQDAGRCLVVSIDVLQIWDDVVVSPFGVVDKSDGDPAITGRTIHDLSFPQALSINDLTDTSLTPAPSYMPCSAVVKEIIRTKHCNGSSVPTLLMGGDVASAFRHLSVHSQSVKYFGGVIPEHQVLVLDLCAPFGWTLSPAEYDVFGGAISHIHGSTFDRFAPDGFFRYHWVDDHVNVSRDNPGHCDAVERSIRRAMTVVLGPGAINEEKFTSWQARLKVLGLLFDTEAMTVAMPPTKIAKAARIVRDTQTRSSLSRSEFRSLLGSLRHVATCIRPARAFLQRLRAAERCDHRQHRVPITAAIAADLQWWAMILEHKSLNGVPMSFFADCPAPDVTVSVDASNYGLCAADHSSRFFLTYQFTSRECSLILDLLNGKKNGFDINYRELLSLAFAVHAWGSRWARPPSFPPTHVRFLIDNTSAVSWQTRLSSPNLRAQNIIRLLALWEVRYNLRCSSIHLPGRDNTLADLGSRIAQSTGNANRFRDLTQSWHITQVPDDSSFFDQLWLNISESVPSPSQH